MDLLTKNDLKNLLENQKGLCISIFMPTHRSGPETQQNLIRFKNLLREAERRLLATGLRASELEELLKPAQALLNDRSFWQYQSDGLVIFLSQETFSYYSFPLNFEELIVITDRFHTKPLLSLFNGDGRFYVLALSQNQVKLFQGTRFSVSELKLKGVPKDIHEALKYDDSEKQLQFHTRTPGGTGKRAAMFHGHGIGKDDSKENTLRYFRQINKGVYDLLKEETAPLVLAGVDYLFSIYKEANTYPHLVEEGIVGNPEELSAQELHSRTWNIVKCLFLRAQGDAIKQYKQLANTKQASCDTSIIVPAAYHGRIELLFVAVGIHQWGTFNQDSNDVLVHQKAEPGSGDLLDFAAIHTLLNGGIVYAVKPKKVPDDAPLAAVFRY
jgi:hypothetical protein